MKVSYDKFLEHDPRLNADGTLREYSGIDAAKDLLVHFWIRHPDGTMTPAVLRPWQPVGYFKTRIAPKLTPVNPETGNRAGITAMLQWDEISQEWECVESFGFDVESGVDLETGKVCDVEWRLLMITSEDDAELDF